MIRSLSCLLMPALLLAAPIPKNLSPAGTVERQIELFNAHDLEGFLALFAEDVDVRPHQLLEFVHEAQRDGRRKICMIAESERSFGT